MVATDLEGVEQLWRQLHDNDNDNNNRAPAQHGQPVHSLNHILSTHAASLHRPALLQLAHLRRAQQQGTA